MPVSQRLIDLLNAPMPVLRRLAATHGLEGLSATRKWDLAQQLANLPRDELEEQSGGYLYAGSTSVSWIRFAPEDQETDAEDPDAFYPLRGMELPGAEVADALREHSESDPFSETARPDEITQQPKLVVAREWEDGYMLSFAVARPLGHTIHNFEHSPILQDEFFTALVRPNMGSVEVRASASRARLLERTWLREFATSFDAKPVPVAITRRDFVALHDELDGRLDVFKGKTTTGTTVFDTHQYTKAEEVDDLLQEPEFQQATANQEPVSVDLLFDAEDFGEVRVHVSVLNGSIFIRTAVPERVVRYVYEVLERIKSGNAGGP